jgi:site-specific DNA recombinase
MAKLEGIPRRPAKRIRCAIYTRKSSDEGLDQAFNSLDVLLSFAQFEREVIGERVRDKIAASKKKGMWMGGMPPLGYDVKNRKLVVNKSEARVVVDIYRRYLTLKSVRDLHDELAGAGIRSKRRARPDGTTYGGQKIARGALYLMLQNRIYRGEITHKGRSYPGEHPAIIDQPLWDEVQVVLAQNRVERATGARTKYSSLLSGFVFDATGERLTPTYAIKKGTRYRYYVSSSLVREARGNHSSGWRLPAGDLEGLVIRRLRNFFADPAALLDAVDNHPLNGLGQSQLIKHGRQIAGELSAETPEKAKATLLALLCRVTIYSDRIEIALCRGRAAELPAGQSIDSAAQHQRSNPASHDVITLRVPARLKRVGREIRMLVEGADDQTAADPSLLRVIARAHDLQGRLSQNTDLTVHDIAREERVTAAYIYMLLRLPWLAPDITTAIVNGRQPQQLSAKTLMRKASRLPADWTEQRTLLGF